MQDIVHRHLHVAGLGALLRGVRSHARGWKIHRSTLTRVHIDTEGEYVR